MVKFGRHLEYYAAAQHAQAAADAEATGAATVATGTAAESEGGAQDSSFASFQKQQSFLEPQHDVLYVVPYNEIKAKCIPPYIHGDTGGEEKKAEDEAEEGFEESGEKDAHDVTAALSKDQEQEEHPQAKTKGKHRNKPPPSPLSPDDAYFIAQRFKTEWRQCLASASRDFERSTKSFWRRVFDGLEWLAADKNVSAKIDLEMIRGALPDTALRLYLVHTEGSQRLAEIQALYTYLKNIHSTALINSEALRKLVKKFDKEMGRLGCADKRLSSRLLPEVYCANFNVGLPTVEAGLALVRYHNDEEYDEDEDDERLDEVHAARIKFMSMDGGAGGGLAGLIGAGGDGKDDIDGDGGPAEDVAGFFGLTVKRHDSDAILVEKRKSELRWLRKLVESVKEADAQARADGDGFAVDMISCLVGHRGFHSIKDKSDKRPLENSLMAYEAAWTNGIHLCECDIALTADDRLILAHDENFVRLALDLDDPLVHKNVGDLTYKEIMSLPLKSGNRPPLLFDVLRSAQVIGGDARMIVEIKPGNVEAGTALAKMFARHPHLMERCAVVMSFDAYAMQNLKRELELVFPSVGEDMMETPGIPSSWSDMRVGTPEQHDLATVGLATGGVSSTANISGPHAHHSHRRGLSVGGGGIIPNIPTAMSIGDIKSLAPAHAAAVTAADTAGGAAVGLGARDRSKSIDQLGLTLEGLDGIGVRKDSFNFNPFGQMARVPSIHRQISGGSKLIPPPSAAVGPAQPATTLETIPGGKRVGFARPPLSPGAAPLLSDEPAATPSSSPPPPPKIATTVVIPQLLLITRNGPAQNKEQEDALEVDVSKPSDIERVKSWLHGGSPRDRLDGLYMQYQPIMLEPEGIRAMETLTEQYSVGIWGANPKPDSYECFSRLVRDCGVSYVNSGLPKRFMRNIGRSESSGNLAQFADRSSAANMEINSLTWPKPPKQTVHLGLPW